MQRTLDQVLDEDDYHLVVDERFEGTELDRDLWLPHYLPQWSSREASAARYQLTDGTLELRIDAHQDPWCPELDGNIRVSSLQTGVFAGPVGTGIGQHRFHPDAVVREAQDNARLYTPQYGVFVLRGKAPLDPACMAALWMIGYEDHAEASGVIDIFEIFGKAATADRAKIAMNVKAFSDPDLVDDEGTVELAIDVSDFHDYAARWTPDAVTFYVDGQPVRHIDQSPRYPMQFMLGFYEFEHDPDPDAYPKRFAIDRFRAYETLPG